MSHPGKIRWSTTGFAVTIFLSAFLLFQVQPLISKYILPWFGGSPAVWTTCMLFFQVVLFAGYAYAHFITTYFRPAVQAVVHLGIMLLAIVVLPIAPDVGWKTAAGEPVLRIVLLLGSSVGLPYFVLSSTGPLLQVWFGRTHQGVSPYRLYALSNVGSLLALVSYPFVVEPAFGIQIQTIGWSWTFGLFALFCSLCAIRMCKKSADDNVVANELSSADDTEILTPMIGERFLWFGLAMIPSIMLLATTNQVCMDVAVIPFLWVLPLTIYLLSFILCFDSDRWYSRGCFAVALAVTTASVVTLMVKGSSPSLIAQVALYFAFLFFCCMVCHGELVRLKPHPRYLTAFYLTMSAGGAGGGVFVGLIAPMAFSSFYEMHVGIVACCILMLIILYRDPQSFLSGGRPRWLWTACCLGLTGFAMSLFWQVRTDGEGTLATVRNFYGVLRVKAESEKEGPSKNRSDELVLYHGRIRHGMQFNDTRRRMWPTAYYGEKSGVGLALRHHKYNQAKKVGIVGLGVGTVATYGQPGDSYRFYEINPAVIDLANQYFTFMSRSQADIQIIAGDARISMENEAEQNFDVLILDAFSGDAIPTHLLTKEALSVYLHHLKPDGILAIHITNRHLDLRPVVAGLVNHAELESVTLLSPKNQLRGTNIAHWALLSRQADSLKIPEIELASESRPTRRLLWTDAHSDLFSILKRPSFRSPVPEKTFVSKTR